LIAEDRQEALERLYEEPIYKSRPKTRQPTKMPRRSRARKLNITDDFDSLPDEAWDEIYKQLAELMVNHISKKNSEIKLKI